MAHAGGSVQHGRIGESRHVDEDDVRVGAVRLVVVDTDAAVRSAVRSGLSDAGFEVIGEADDARGAVAACAKLQPDVCLLDIGVAGGGIGAARSIREAAPGVHVVMLTDAIDDDDLFDALTAGVSGYLSKSMISGRLAESLRGVLAGEAALSRSLAGKVVAEFRTRQGKRYQIGRRGRALTEPEWDVLERMADGMSTQDIAKDLSVSTMTVRIYTSSIVKKLAVHDRQSVVAFVRDQRA